MTFLIRLALAFAIPSPDGSESRISSRGSEVGIKDSISKELASDEGTLADEKSRPTAPYQSIYSNQDNIQVIYLDSEGKSDHFMMQQPDHVIIINEPEEFEKRQQQQQQQQQMKQQFQPQEHFEQPQETYQQSKEEVQQSQQQFQKAQEQSQQQIQFPGEIIEKEIDKTKPEQSEGFKEIVNEDKQNRANDKSEEMPVQITIEYEQDSPVKGTFKESQRDKEPSVTLEQSATLEQLIKPKSQFDPIDQPKPVEVVQSKTEPNDEQTFVLPIITKVIPVKNKAEKHGQDDKEENSLSRGPNDFINKLRTRLFRKQMNGQRKQFSKRESLLIKQNIIMKEKIRRMKQEFERQEEIEKQKEFKMHEELLKQKEIQRQEETKKKIQRQRELKRQEETKQKQFKTTFWLKPRFFEIPEQDVQTFIVPLFGGPSRERENQISFPKSYIPMRQPEIDIRGNQKPFNPVEQRKNEKLDWGQMDKELLERFTSPFKEELNQQNEMMKKQQFYEEIKRKREFEGKEFEIKKNFVKDGHSKTVLNLNINQGINYLTTNNNK